MLTGQVAVVTGGSRGIGAAIAKKLASQGADVAILYAGNQEAAQAVCQECQQASGARAMAYRCDVSDFQQAKETVAQIKADLGTVNILVNNAGVTKDGLIATMKEQDFDAVVDTNLKGAFNMIRHCCGLFIRNRGGRIVNVSSVSGMIGNAGQANYSASKAGIIGLTKATAKELAPRGITCNAVAPGFVETDMTRSLALDEEKIAAAIPLGRLAKPEEIADAVAFLVSADYITGEVLRVDGGIAM
jgi:3-oxoacyl-[acyl-carrier protein] reductase